MNTETMGQRRIDLERLLGFLQLLLLAKKRQRAHVVQAIGKLDHDHANVLGHREDHLAIVLSLGFFARGELDLRELGDTLHQYAHLGTKALLDLVGSRLGVFDDIVQQGANQNVLGLPQLGADLGNAPRVVDEWLAAPPQLSVVMQTGYFEGRRNAVGIRVGRVLENILDQLIEQFAVNLRGGYEFGNGHCLANGTGVRFRIRRTPQPRGCHVLPATTHSSPTTLLQGGHDIRAVVVSSLPATPRS
ncbi:unannotated protein [freshwater metagenome]|uniref:Unannotated protein n=1 Tax=freshwater metagenome TaxID=449393 RepID=A0A6J7IU86_9ZZZZ